MREFVVAHEAQIRLGFFVAVFVLIAAWEILAPRRRLRFAKSRRWLNNLLLVAINTLVLRLLFPAAAVGMAVFAQTHAWGVLHLVALPYGLSVLLAIVIMDLVIYLQHVMMHAVPLFWRLHRVHHADPDFDVTTGLRFHPLEIILSMLLKFATIAVLGPPVLAVILFEIVLNAMAMFNHGNIRLPAPVDKLLRIFVVTPDMHRVHHSVEEDEANSNFGFNLSCWDRLFGTWRAQPRAGHAAMKIGVFSIEQPEIMIRLTGMLQMPFIAVQGYVINRRWRGRS